jgi:hypothetical protein
VLCLMPQPRQGQGARHRTKSAGYFLSLLQQQIIMYIQRIDIATIYPRLVCFVKSAKIFAPGLTPAAQQRAAPKATAIHLPATAPPW